MQLAGRYQNLIRSLSDAQDIVYQASVAPLHNKLRIKGMTEPRGLLYNNLKDLSNDAIEHLKLKNIPITPKNIRKEAEFLLNSQTAMIEDEIGITYDKKGRLINPDTGKLLNKKEQEEYYFKNTILPIENNHTLAELKKFDPDEFPF